MGSGGYSVSHGGMGGQAKELDGCGDDAGTIRKAVSPKVCYASDTLGGTDAGPAFERFAAAWEAEARTLEGALHELAGKVGLASASYHGSDHVVQKQTSSVHVPTAPHSTAPHSTTPAPSQRSSALSSY